MKKTFFLYIFISSLLLSGLFSCDNKDCITFGTRIMIVQFLDSAGGQKSKPFSFITSDASEVVFYSDTTLSILGLPVNTSDSQTTFLFGNPDNTLDSLVVGYEKRVKLINEDCGFELTFNTISIISTTYPNAVSLENDLSILNDSNIEIYH